MKTEFDFCPPAHETPINYVFSSLESGLDWENLSQPGLCYMDLGVGFVSTGWTNWSKPSRQGSCHSGVLGTTYEGSDKSSLKMVYTWVWFKFWIKVWIFVM